MIGTCHSAQAEGAGSVIAGWLSLAAAPAFAVMALLAGGSAGSPMDGLCGQGHAVLGGMAPMYLLMSAVHLVPWLRLASARRA